ncbi:hypothetical protein [Sinorhizobium meliloti]|nr:hypothetical protein U8C30_23980 [Sinorhizobium meliloti]
MSDPQYELKQWLAEKLAARGVASKLAGATGMSNDKITRSKELHSDDPKKRRQISLQEIEAMARFFRELPPGFEQMTRWLEDLPPPPRPSRYQTPVSRRAGSNSPAMLRFRFEGTLPPEPTVGSL